MTHPTLKETQAEFTRRYLLETLDLAGWNISEASRLAGRNRTDFYKICQRHGVEWEKKQTNFGNAVWRELRA